MLEIVLQMMIDEGEGVGAVQVWRNILEGQVLTEREGNSS